AHKRLQRRGALQFALGFGLLTLLGGFALALSVHLDSGLRPTDSGYGAALYGLLALQGLFVVAVAMMQLYTSARAAHGLISDERRVTFVNTRLFWLYTVGQGLLVLALLHGFPRVAS